jgi:hypothetical protein
MSTLALSIRVSRPKKAALLARLPLTRAPTLPALAKPGQTDHGLTIKEAAGSFCGAEVENYLGNASSPF